MLAIFTEHFWRHVWGPWGEERLGIIKEGPATHEPCKYVERVCKVCGKRERFTL